MAACQQCEADVVDGLSVNCGEQDATFAAQLRRALNMVPAHTWYAAPAGALTFVNKPTADYLGLPKDDPLRFGIDKGAAWDSHIPLLHPEDHEETRSVWSNCLRTRSPGDVSFRLRNAQGGYRWFISRTEPLRASDGTLILWIGINLDIEERMQLTRALHKTEEELRQILEAPNGRGRLLPCQSPRPTVPFDARHPRRNGGACTSGVVSSHAIERILLHRVLDYVTTHIDDDIALEDLAGMAGYSPFHFARKFTLAMGVSPHRYIARLRLERAMAQLAAGKLPLVEIALNAGFSSQASFTRAFHRATGLTPKEYQRLKL